MGCTVSMDDFCTGYSSIAMLQHLDMDVMKIDRAMLLAAESSDRGLKILRRVVALGSDLDILVLCEGELSGILDARETDKNEVGLYMTSLHGEGGEAS